ncbi:hypothetical protein GCM10007862_35560 [Dyella lipolytica]|uniref:Sel1 repeat family protein n=1 Tax=Dyella lipolytica TaxID=1867835 RepID=A0ABW8IPV8_9GAMM|nr:tetratricopeptide repeat protein [Dyella lipolytica]GLQ48505.1 hypothetical protein GCM10007862_35560 [Dyella lipolytica]
MTELDCVKRLAELDVRGETALAIEYCEKFPCSENSKCQRYLGWINAERKEYEKAVEWYLKAAAQGDAKAIEECWACVLNIDASGNIDRAIELCRTAPLSEHLNFQRYLAKAYFDQGNIDQTLHWSLKIAECGGAEDLLYVAKLYLSEGKPSQAIDFLKRAASVGSVRAHQLLGEMYGFGIGVTKDSKVAANYYHKKKGSDYFFGRP